MPFETPDLIEEDIAIPSRKETDSFVIRPLRVTDAEADFDAITESRDQIKNIFGPDHPWPPKDLTLEQNQIDVAWHQKEHQRRDAFTFTVCEHDNDMELGCLYIQPTQVYRYDATVYFWISQTALKHNLSDDITISIKQWISDEWPLDKVAYPGREIEWEEWQALKQD
jgi:hypothetical protein